jgi:starch phosphorylase
MNDTKIRIAYFSAEIGISAKLPTYSGGLGVLAGDHIKAAADSELPMCAITLLYKEGYFKQRLDDEGRQTEVYPRFDPDPLLKKLPIKFTLPLRKRDVWIQVYEYRYTGLTGHEIPIYFLDTNLEENFTDDQIITMRLYSGDKDHRILQEAILGFGGIKLLDELQYTDIGTYHMNEGHAAFIIMQLLRKFDGNHDEVRKRCHFTTHTPVPAGHDEFAIDRCERLLDGLLWKDISKINSVQNGRLHMTELGLHFSRSANGVSKLHGKVAQDQFPDYKIGHITNGVYHPYWVGKEFREVFDNRLPGWRTDPERLLNVDAILPEELIKAHQSHKDFLLGYANSQTQKALSNEILTIGFARRAAGYKRARLIFKDIERLKNIGSDKLQIIFAGKAHPADNYGKSLIYDVVQNAKKLFGKVKIIYLENYNLWLGRIITSGVDVWLNTPLRPHEASGTSGMKAALNGIPNLSILDGWWDEACQHGENGWAVGNPDIIDDDADANHLYNILDKEVIPTFYNNQDKWASMMVKSIITGVQFTAFRMINDYKEKYYKV